MFFHLLFAAIYKADNSYISSAASIKRVYLNWMLSLVLFVFILTLLFVVYDKLILLKKNLTHLTWQCKQPNKFWKWIVTKSFLKEIGLFTVMSCRTHESNYLDMKLEQNTWKPIKGFCISVIKQNSLILVIVPCFSAYHYCITLFFEP